MVSYGQVKSVLNLIGPDGVGFCSGCDMTTDSAQRWAWTVFEGVVYFTNVYTPLHLITPDNYVRRLNDQAVNDGQIANGPAGKYLDVFYDHLVLSNVNHEGIFPNRILWSALRDFGNFTPRKDNEADHYDIMENHGGVITGQGTLRDRLIVYGPSTITTLQYVGQPTLIHASTRVGIGNSFPYAVIKTDSLHAFVSDRWKCFFKYDGENDPVPFGLEVAGAFFADLNPDLAMRARTWGYFLPDEAELHWVYCSTASTGAFDKEIVFQIDRDSWYFKPSSDIWSVYPNAVQLFKPINQLSGQIQALSGSIGSLGGQENHGPLWGTGDGRLIERSSYGDSVVESLAGHYLETHDIWLEPKAAPKEVSSMELFASCKTGSKIEVYFSVRNSPGATITWTKLAQDWTPGLREQRLSFPRCSGRIWRFKFVPVVVAPEELSVQGFVLNVDGTKAEK